MATIEIGEVFVPETPEEWRDGILADIRLEGRKTTTIEPAVQPGTDDYRWATAVSNAAYLIASAIAIERDNVTPLRASGDGLEDWRRALGLPEVQPSPSTGKLVLTVDGTSSMPQGTQFVLPNGLRGEVAQTYPSVTDGSEVSVRTIDKGSATELSGGSIVRFVSPPINVHTEAEVSKNAPLTGGLDAETDNRKRARIANRLGNKPAGGNWADLRETALNELASLVDCFVYPALGGPGSVKVVPVRDFDEDNSEFTRAPNDAALGIIRNALYRDFPDQQEIVVQAPADQSVDATVKLEIPASVFAGGDGTGWLDETPWPPLVGGDNGRVTATAGSSAVQFTLSAGTATPPVPGQSHIAWWSPDDRVFYTRLVIELVSGGAGAWVIKVDAPLVSKNGVAIATGDFVSPAAVNIEQYGRTWLSVLRKLGPGENTSDVNRIPRALRHPYQSDESPSDIAFLALANFQDGHDEVTDAEWGYRSVTTPTTPTLAATAPNILVPRHFGLYQLI